MNRDTARYCSECGTPLLSGLSGPVAAPEGTPPAGATPDSAPVDPTITLKDVVQVNNTAMLLGRYRLEKELGRGGFGAVYKAYDENLSRPCAIKENLEVSADAQRQFAREASVLANLTHPNLPRVTDHFTIPGQGQYLVMDFVEGEDLATILEHQRTITPTTATAWVLQVAEALDYLHDQTPPVLHRDIKPANIRLTPRGKAMLVDFGLVKLYDASARTTVGARAVTPGYAPPEQYGRGNTDARSDIYALAATLFHMVTGEQPVESVQRITGHSSPTASQLNPNVPPALSEVISKGMALDPAQRYQSAHQFCQALQEALHNASEVPTAYGMRSPVAPGGGPAQRPPSGQKPPSGQRPPSGQKPPSGQRPPSGQPQTMVAGDFAQRPDSRPASQPVKKTNRLIPILIGGTLLVCGLGAVGGSALLGISLLPPNTTATSQALATKGAELNATRTAQAAEVQAKQTRPAGQALPTPTRGMAAAPLPGGPEGLPNWPAVNGGVAYNDATSGWRTGDNTSSTLFDRINVSASAEAINVTLKPKKADIFWYLANDKLITRDRFIYSATLRQVSGSPDAWQGLLFRQMNDTNFYVFLVRDSGEFGVYKYNNGKWNAIQEPTKNPAVKAGQAHTLLVYGQGTNFALYIDNNKVAEVTISDFSTGSAGIYFEITTKMDAVFEASKINLQAP